MARAGVREAATGVGARCSRFAALNYVYCLSIAAPPKKKCCTCKLKGRFSFLQTPVWRGFPGGLCMFTGTPRFLPPAIGRAGTGLG